MSRGDVERGVAGSREYYWAMDVHVAPSEQRPTLNSLVVIIDVDYYFNLESFLSNYFTPVAIYTLIPKSAAASHGEYSYTFDASGALVVNVRGGCSFKHGLWDYAGDQVLAIGWQGIVPVSASLFSIDRREVSGDRCIVLFTPIRRWRGPALVLPLLLEHKRLQRINPVFGNFARLRVYRDDGLYVSTALLGAYTATTVTVQIDDTIAGVARTAYGGITLPQVVGYIPDGDRTKAMALYEYHKESTKGVPPLIVKVSEGVRAYQFNPLEYDSKATNSMVAFMQPIVHGAFCPDKTHANEERAIYGRVEAVKPGILPLTHFLTQVIDEFCMFLIPKPYQLFPVEEEIVFERQCRPTQQRILRRAEMEVPIKAGSVFMKPEAYPEPKEPRLITQINGSDKRDYSRFMYSFEDILKAQPWYAFGLTPATVAARVAAVCERANYVVKSDFSRFDGHGSNLMRMVERTVLLRAFHESTHSQLIKLHDSQFNMIATAKFRSKFATWFTRSSGSPETSLFNSLVNAFIAFLGFRMTKRNGVFIQGAEAWAMLGIYGGDDGLTPDMDLKKYVQASTTMGQVVKAEMVERGKIGVEFLARWYSPDVWTGDDNSCCDVLRQISKLHVTVRRADDVKPLEKFLEKMRCFTLTDMCTPIIGTLSRHVTTKYGELKANERCEYIRPWNFKDDFKVQYPNREADWMWDQAKTKLPTFDFHGFHLWLDSIATVTDYLESPCFMEPKPVERPVAPMFVDGDVVPRGPICVQEPLLTRGCKPLVGRGW
jgi:hypothetical protein